MTNNSSAESSLKVISSDSGLLQYSIKGSLDSNTLEEFWEKTEDIIKQYEPKNIVVDAGELTHCNTVGTTYFINLKKYSEEFEYNYEVKNLPEEFNKLLNLFSSYDPTEEIKDDEDQLNLVENIGKSAATAYDDNVSFVSFIGETSLGFVKYFTDPSKVRLKDILVVCEKVGVNALLIIALINFLVGLVIAFQSAIPLAQYGGTVFVADLLVLSVFKELGPLMTAIVVNGRTSSAFAAEIGTMKVNEEIDALTTMGIDKIRFLVMPKFIGTLAMLPVLTLFGILFALLGGLVVFLTLGFPPITYLNQMTNAASYVDLGTGLFKTIFFALIIAGVGCYEGLRTKSGASAVGDSTTKAVVGGLILIVLVDGVFGVIYYFLGI